MRRAVKHANY